jgi:GNAT superfamily N-acetyltransferase
MWEQGPPSNDVHAFYTDNPEMRQLGHCTYFEDVYTFCRTCSYIFYCTCSSCSSIVGVVVVAPEEHAGLLLPAVLTSVYVLPSHRNHGIASSLVGLACSVCDEHHLPVVHVYPAKNVGASWAAVFTNNHFRPCSLVKGLARWHICE